MAGRIPPPPCPGSRGKEAPMLHDSNQSRHARTPLFFVRNTEGGGITDRRGERCMP